jgi:insulysin
MLTTRLTSKMAHGAARAVERFIERITDSMETPLTDDRCYRVIKLPNQLEVLLVHDAETDKASAAMDVNVGNFSDEEDMSGMAHVRIIGSLKETADP